MNKPLRIAFLDLDDVRNPLLGAGQATATAGVGAELVKRGHSVTVFCSRYPGAQDRVENGIRYIHKGFSTSNIKLNNLLYILTVPFIVRRLRDFDVIVECFTAPVSTLLSPLFTKIPVVALPSMFNAAEFSRKYKLPFAAFERWGMQFYKYMLPYSDIDSAKAQAMNPRLDFRIVSQGVGKEYFSVRPSKPQHLLFLSRFDMDQKGIDLLLEAYSLVKKEMKYPLVLAGHGPDEARIRELISRFQLEDKVRMVGSAYGEKKMKLMREAAFVVFPSRHDEICLWTLEALAAGLPLVAFDLPESRWIPSEVALKAPRFDTKAYARLLIEMQDKKVLDGMRKASRRFAKHFSWEKVASAFESYFEYVREREGIRV